MKTKQTIFLKMRKILFHLMKISFQDKLNIYGSHPFYQMLEKNGKTHGVFLRNSNAMGNNLFYLFSFLFLQVINSIFYNDTDCILEGVPVL